MKESVKYQASVALTTALGDEGLWTVSRRNRAKANNNDINRIFIHSTQFFKPFQYCATEQQLECSPNLNKGSAKRR